MIHSNVSHRWYTPPDGTIKCEPPMIHSNVSHRWYTPPDGAFKCEPLVAHAARWCRSERFKHPFLQFFTSLLLNVVVFQTNFVEIYISGELVKSPERTGNGSPGRGLLTKSEGPISNAPGTGNKTVDA
ncbi:hypothetical protein AVEN_159160-1 [Araneus ventricosus]|uniref:Uncharacterized protein n=1 Tax=Araneus ventricosus TaxID=182803 RepID=A0A4Y2LF31_ARAVE|nr:hypothetical protein AVEN_159160-1 [Araneus ventricosus]